MNCYFAVSKNGFGCIFASKPIRVNDKWITEDPSICSFPIPVETINQILGYELTWENEPVKV